MQLLGHWIRKILRLLIASSFLLISIGLGLEALPTDHFVHKVFVAYIEKLGTIGVDSTKNLGSEFADSIKSQIERRSLEVYADAVGIYVQYAIVLNRPQDPADSMQFKTRNLFDPDFRSQFLAHSLGSISVLGKSFAWQPPVLLGPSKTDQIRLIFTSELLESEMHNSADVLSSLELFDDIESAQKLKITVHTDKVQASCIDCNELERSDNEYHIRSDTGYGIQILFTALPKLPPSSKPKLASSSRTWGYVVQRLNLDRPICKIVKSRSGRRSFNREQRHLALSSIQSGGTGAGRLVAVGK